MNLSFHRKNFVCGLAGFFGSRRRWASLAVAGAVLACSPGCVFMAVRAVKAVDRAVNPPQAPLLGTETFFGGAVSATVRLIPFNAEARERWRKRQGVGAEADDETMMGQASGRTVLLAVVRNTGGTDLALTIASLESPRGRAAGLPLTVLLAAGQRNVLMPVPADAPEGAEPVEKLEVTLSLKKAGDVETKTIELKARAGAKE